MCAAPFSSIFLFLFTGLLLQTNPDGIGSDRILFSVVVGMLTTSIVVFTFFLFLRELFHQLLAALHEVDEEEAAEELEWELQEQEDMEHDGTLTLVNGKGGDGDGAPGGGSWRTRFFVVACVALTLGLGLGLGLKHAPPPPAFDDGVTRFTLVINRERLLSSPTVSKMMITINGTSPGPTLVVPFGRSVEVTVINAMTDDATTVHWHGMQMRGTPFSDGVPGVSQCPIPAAAAGSGAEAGLNAMVYRFTPDRPGTFWYHGHFAGQYVDGLVGGLLIDDGGATFAAAAAGDARAAYDAHDWLWMPADWYNEPASELLVEYLSPASGGDEPMPDAIVVNGQLTNTLSYNTSRATRQLVRVINTAAFSMWTVSVDGMPLTLVELDGVAVQPLDVPSVTLNVAQRCAFVLDFSRLHPDIADSPAIWFRVEAMPDMYPTFDPEEPDSGLVGTAGEQPFSPHWAGLIRFTDSSDDAAAAPTYSVPPALTLPSSADVNVQAARSWPPAAAPPATHSMYVEVVFQADALGVNRAYINNATFPMISPSQLTSPLLYAYTRAAADSPLVTAVLPGRGALVGSATSPYVVPFGAVVDIMINNTDGGEHPFHLHGHTVWVVATSAAPDAGALYAPYYTMRDVVSVPANGWAKIRFVADNPGVWLLHCQCVRIFVRACTPLRSDALTLANPFCSASSGTCTQG